MKKTRARILITDLICRLQGKRLAFHPRARSRGETWRRLILAAALLASTIPAFGQAPAPVPALPDSERRTSYSITGTTCSCGVGFALFGDGVDFNNWVEVWLNGVLVNYNDATFGWTITVPTQTLATRSRPISDAILTFNSAQTGTVQIVGARRPRRVSQFGENRGVAARDLNQALTDIISQNREIWDKTNDFTGRGFFAPPGQTGGIVSGPLSGIISGPSSVPNGNLAVWNGTSGAALKDGGAPAPSATIDTTNASNITSGTLALARLPATFLPGSSVVGNIAFWNNTSGTALAATPAYQAGNPANSAIYSAAPDPTTGYTGVFNALQIDQGAGVTAAQQFGQIGGGQPIRQAIVGTTVIPSTDTTTWQAAGVAGYARGDVAGTGRNLVGVFGQSSTTVANSNVFGLNGVAVNNSGSCFSGCTDGKNLNYIAGAEVDVNLWKVGAADPTVAGGNVYGLTIAGSGNIAAQVSGSAAIVANMMGVATSVPWNYGLRTYDGAASIGAQYGTNGTGNNVNSQPVRFVGRTAGAVNKTTDIHGDPNGAMIIAPDSTSTVVAHLNGIGGSTIWQTGDSFGTAKQQVPSCTTQGVLTNDTAGNINCPGSLGPALGGAIYAVSATGVNFNAVGDTALVLKLPSGFTRVFPWSMHISHASGSLTTAQFGVFTNTGGGGATIQSATAITVSTAADATANNAQANNFPNNVSFVAASLPTPNTIYFRVTTPQGSAATGDYQFVYFVLP